MSSFHSFVRANVRTVRRLALVTTLCGTGSLLVAGTARAQSSDGSMPGRPVTFGIMGGFAHTPLLDAQAVEGAARVGFNASASAEARTPLRALRLRADALVADWGPDRMGALTLNGLLVAPVRWSAVPYLSAGLGGYSARDGRLTAGYSVGGGLRLPTARRTVVVESRVHVFGNDQFRRLEREGGLGPGAVPTRAVWLPISLGVQF